MSFLFSFHLLQCLVHRRNPMVAHLAHHNKEHNALCRHRDLLPLLHLPPKFHYSTFRNLHFRRWSHNFYHHWLRKFNACQPAFNSWCPTPIRWLYLHHRATHLWPTLNLTMILPLGPTKFLQSMVLLRPGLLFHHYLHRNCHHLPLRLHNLKLPIHHPNEVLPSPPHLWPLALHYPVTTVVIDQPPTVVDVHTALQDHRDATTTPATDPDPEEDVLIHLREPTTAHHRSDWLQGLPLLHPYNLAKIYVIGANWINFLFQPLQLFQLTCHPVVIPPTEQFAAKLEMTLAAAAFQLNYRNLSHWTNPTRLILSGSKKKSSTEPMTAMAPTANFFYFDHNLIRDMAMVLAKGGILPRLHRERISARRIFTSDGNPTKNWALCVNLEGYFNLLPPFRSPHSQTDPAHYSYTWIHATHDGSISRILKEGIVRPSMWSFNDDPSMPAGDFPAYGFFGVGAVGGWHDPTAWTTLGNNSDIRKFNCLRWILAGTLDSNVQHKGQDSGGNWDLQRYAQSHGVAHGRRSRHWTFNSNNANIKYLITLYRRASMCKLFPPLAVQVFSTPWPRLSTS